MTEGRVHWRRFGLLLVPSMVVTAVFGLLVSSGTLAASVRFQDGNARVTTSGIYAIDGAILVGETERYSGSQRSLKIAVAQALMNELCLSEPVLNGLATLRVSAGDGDPRTWETSANSALLDASAAKGSVAMDGIVNMGIDASTVDTGPLETGTRTGYFGIEAGFADLRRVEAGVAALRVSGALEAPNIKFALLPGTGTANQCPAMPEPVYNGVKVNPPAAGSIAGTVKDGGGNPIPGVRVALYNAEGELNSVRTDSSGAYRIFAFVGRSVKVSFTHRRYAERWNGGATSQGAASPVAITSTTPVTGVNVTLPGCPGLDAC